MKKSLRRALLAGAVVAAAGVAVPVISASASESCAPAWTAGAVYKGGDVASQGGSNFTAAWWTQGDDPATHNGPKFSGMPWTDKRSCGGGGGGTTPTQPTQPPTQPTQPPTQPTQPPTQPTQPPTQPTQPPSGGGGGGSKLVGYFVNWGVYGRNFTLKNLQDSGQAGKMTHLLYAFGNVTNGQCALGDNYADTDMAFTADRSVDGKADNWEQPLRGNINQLKKLKAANPNLKVIWSFGGWTWSGGFPQAAANPDSFAKGCKALVDDPRWKGVFDGIDIDWEYPNACGLSCDTTSGPKGYGNLIASLRKEFNGQLVTSAISADGTDGGKLEKANYAEAAKNLDLVFPMTYDYFGAWDAQGPTRPHSPLTKVAGAEPADFYSDKAIQKLKGMGIPASKMLLGVGFYGRGWTGVSSATPGGSATGAAPGKYELGIQDYKDLKSSCPSTGKIAGTAYAFCNGQWWGYDTPETIKSKMKYAKDQGLGGGFFWEASGDSNGELVGAMRDGLK